MSYQNVLKYGAPAVAAVALLLVVAWAFKLPPVAALTERAGDASQLSQPAGNQMTSYSYDAIQVSGVGTATAAPDIANLSLSVSATAPTVAAARSTAAAAAVAVRATLTANGVADADVVTSHFRVRPEYEYGESGRTLVGYNVTNGMAVTIRTIANVGPIIDAAIVAGGDNIVFDGVSFAISNTAALERQARQAAIDDMTTRAEQVAEFSKRTLGDLKMVSEVPTPEAFSPVFNTIALADSASAAPPTPISTGENSVTVSLYGVFELRR